MDWIQLNRQEIETDALPPVCIRCGEPATRKHNQTFEWHPTWADWLIFLGFVPGIIAIALMARKQRISMPVCELHHPDTKHPPGPSILPALLVLLLLPISCGLVGGVVALWISQTPTAPQGEGTPESGEMLKLALPTYGGAGAMVGVLIAFGIVLFKPRSKSAGPPKPKAKQFVVEEISTAGVTLVGVSDAFVAAVIEGRKAKSADGFFPSPE